VAGAIDRIPAPALFVFSGLTQYGGAALAVSLFARIPADGVAWARVAVAAAVLLAWRRPWRRRFTRRDLAITALFGVVLTAMNVTFYLAIDLLPLGTAVAIEFIGPVAVAAATGRSARERLAIVPAALGVVLLAGVSLDPDRPGTAEGLAWILVAAACWAAYILAGRKVAATSDGVTRLALAMTAGALVAAPVLAHRAAPAFTDLALAATLVGVAVLSSVVPYAIEQVTMRRLSAATFSVMLALLPATAAVIGFLALGQVPGPADVAGLALVSVAIVLTAVRTPVPARPGPGAGAPQDPSA